jgi:dolichol-phosphate mannosyltransferase
LNIDILVVDDSSDQTGTLVKNKQATEPRLFLIKRTVKSGRGSAVLEGFKFALSKNYDRIIEMDADFSHNPDDLVRLYETAVKESCDLVIGSRYITGVNVVNWPMGRVLMSYFASWYVRFITGMSIRDTTAGFKCYRRVVLETIPLDEISFIGYAFQIEMKFLAWKFGFKIKEEPIIFTDRSRGESKMSRGIFKEAV